MSKTSYTIVQWTKIQDNYIKFLKFEVIIKYNYEDLREIYGKILDEENIIMIIYKYTLPWYSNHINKEFIEWNHRFYKPLALVVHIPNINSSVMKEILQDVNIDVNSRVNSYIQTTVFMRVCINGMDDVAKLFLAHPKINVNFQSPGSMYTALMYACENNRYNIVKLLLKHPQIDVNRENTSGGTAAHIARRRNYKNILEKIKSHKQYKSKKRKHRKKKIRHSAHLKHFPEEKKMNKKHSDEEPTVIQRDRFTSDENETNNEVVVEHITCVTEPQETVFDEQDDNDIPNVLELETVNVGEKTTQKNI